jgi:hypothetical protein
MTLNLKDLARVGAQARLTELREEQAALLNMFPELREGGQRGRKAAPTSEATPTRARKRSSMSASMRKAVGQRMKAYWAKRRAEKAATGDGAQVHVTASNGTSRKSGRQGGRKQGRKK